MRAFSYTNCTECDRPLVPQLTTPPEGHVRHKAKGVCVPCYSKRANQLKPKTTTAADLAKVEHDRRNLESYLAERRARLAQGRGAA